MVKEPGCRPFLETDSQKQVGQNALSNFDLHIHAVPLLVILGSSPGQSASYTFGRIRLGFFDELVKKGHDLQACSDVWPMFGWYVPWGHGMPLAIPGGQ